MLKKKISQHPERYLAQELVEVSQAPVLSTHEQLQISPRGIGLRVHAIKSQSSRTDGTRTDVGYEGQTQQRGADIEEQLGRARDARDLWRCACVSGLSIADDASTDHDPIVAIVRYPGTVRHRSPI